VAPVLAVPVEPDEAVQSLLPELVVWLVVQQVVASVVPVSPVEQPDVPLQV